MSRLRTICLCAVALCLALTVPAFALIGIGIHYGFDNTLSMKNTTGYGDQVTFDNLNLDLGQGSILNGSTGLPIYVSRTNFKSDFAFGGKIYIDVIPFIDAVEVSADFGLWDYVGKINYPSGLKNNPPYPANIGDSANFNYSSENLTLNNFGLGYFGLDNTPYAKLQLDATVRKYIVRVPYMLKVFNLYGGAGLTVNFATPMLSSNLVEEVINEEAQGTKTISTLGRDLLGNSSIMKGVVQKIISGLTQPSYGAHLDLGFMVKIPVIPVGIYVDGKFMIPFAQLDKYVNIGGTGFLLNAGIAWSL